MGHDCDDQETEATKKLLGVDKQEDIKILEEFLVGNKYCEDCEEKCVDCYIEYEEVQAVANLLTRYKELEEENKEYEATLDIFDEREYRKRYLEERRTEEPNLLYPDADEIYKRYFELRENSIPKSKVKEKIEELKEKTAMQGLFIDTETICRVDAKIQVLQELLESEEK